MIAPVDPESSASHPPPVAQRKGWRNWGDHPVVAILTVVASVAGILSYLRASSAPPMSGAANLAGDPAPSEAGRCADVAGRWDWLTTGGVVAIAENGTVMWYRVSTDPVPTINGTWECRANNPRHLTLTWIQTGLVDTVVLSGDGQRFAGANIKTGFKLSATRAR